jgi:hypothetical protein
MALGPVDRACGRPGRGVDRDLGIFWDRPGRVAGLALAERQSGGHVDPAQVLVLVGEDPGPVPGLVAGPGHGHGHGGRDQSAHLYLIRPQSGRNGSLPALSVPKLGESATPDQNLRLTMYSFVMWLCFGHVKARILMMVRRFAKCNHALSAKKCPDL